MENVTFFTLLPETIQGKTSKADEEFMYYVSKAFEFAEKENLNIVNACGVAVFEKSQTVEKYFSRLKRKSTVLILSTAHIGNFDILNSFIEKQVTFLNISGEYLVSAKGMKEFWEDYVNRAKKDYPFALPYLEKLGMLDLQKRKSL
ncbi:hypothetical protein BCJMU51_5462 [Bacillus cereus]|uniref:hypothetical protein n=1 Tax=Bacillus cereus TaxID=1396 RepID=UPI001F484909|nr:hypothetical protein [Bacillus cereus]BCB40544.1 hypothetical protein BCM0045_5439 [Bacillus cereus]BCC03380.1 hypothetical protein BCM0057_5462 [Bacillus cereus]BCC26899.1 hypothetical protein BCM0079_5492 [Bacillus cereus]BCC38459.1 hypothetical protein BCM0105_5449 [Bacillus cereus]BCC44257.1 hypothetical protein BCJMU01_5424 [Bacillus cereus]